MLLVRSDHLTILGADESALANSGMSKDRRRNVAMVAAMEMVLIMILPTSI
jgi:hypothetical protein